MESEDFTDSNLFTLMLRDLKKIIQDYEKTSNKQVIITLKRS